MKLTLKLVGMLFIVILIIIAIDGYLSIRREMALFRQNKRDNALMISNIVGGMVSEIWQTLGKHRALELIEGINRAEHKIQLYWVNPDSLESSTKTFSRDPGNLEMLKAGQNISIEAEDSSGKKYLYTYIPLKSESRTYIGVLELKESFDDLEAYTRETLLRVFILSGVLIVVGTSLLWYLGHRYVGKPLQNIMQRTHRIGTGDFSQDPPLPGHNELTQLSMALNEMCENLNVARKKLELETNKRLAAIEQLRHTERLATVGRLASGVAHELGTPLNVISGRAKIITNEAENITEILNSCRIITEQSERMTKIIRQLLDFARRRRSHRSPADIKPLISQVAEMLKPMALKVRVNIELAVPPDLPKISIDQSQIQQVLINIMVNGIQAMPEGGVIAIKAHKENRARPGTELKMAKNVLAIEIRDQGVGIHPDHINQIFDPFFTTKEVGSGTGLGLSISHGIIEEHGGWIDLQSEINCGTAFTLFLPIEEEN
jgi:two-component system NtrC family sensor kinase